MEDLQKELTPSMMALDIRLYAEIEKALQAGIKAMQYLGEVRPRLQQAIDLGGDAARAADPGRYGQGGAAR